MRIHLQRSRLPTKASIGGKEASLVEAVIGPFDCRRGGVDISQHLVNSREDAHLGRVQSPISIQLTGALVH